MMRLIWLYLICSLAWAAPSKSLYNPKPMADDLELPLPNGEVMVFRPIKVPGASFWGDEQRVIQLGSPGNRMFEGLQRMQVAGSFPEQQDWIYYLGKYELTLGQFLAVMGLEGLLKYSRDPQIKQKLKLPPKKRKKYLKQPATYISYEGFQAFIRAYNRWLFDPDHPERIEKMPRYHGVPGFIRLPTEVEWEYAARGGLEAKKRGIFEQKLPFKNSQINKHAWHVQNAKHKLRPIGLRKPNLLGLYDLFGNAQEIVDGRFYPEIWQGKPGGVPVRGGSVSTSPHDLRSSLRSEFDVWSWNRDQKKVENRASFNTGIRLAIGSNVVVDPQQKQALQKEYQSYAETARKRTPVGQSLQNPLAGAGTSLGQIDPVLQRLAQRHPDIQDDLKTIQHYLNQANKKLDLAQKESARSLAQDAVRNGFLYSLYLNRLDKLQSALQKAQELLAISTRYQSTVNKVQKQIDELNMAAQEQWQAYLDKVKQLGEYEPEYRQYAWQQLEQKKGNQREIKVLHLLKQQAEQYYQNRRLDDIQWKERFIKAFQLFKE